MSVLNECENCCIEDPSLVRSNHTTVIKENQEEQCFTDSLIDLAVGGDVVTIHNTKLHCNSNVVTDKNLIDSTNAVCYSNPPLQSISKISTDKLLAQQVDVLCPNTVYNGDIYSEGGSASLNGCQIPPLSINKDNIHVFEDTISHNQSGSSSEVSSDSDQETSKQHVLKELEDLKNVVCELNLKIKTLESENQRLEADRSHEICIVQLEALEKTIAQLNQDSEKSRQQAETATKNFTSLKKGLEEKLEKVTKQFETANKEKEAMVVRYAVSEKEVIDQKKERETLDKKFKEAIKEKEFFASKLKNITSERTRISQLLDNKCHELHNVHKENERLKEDLNSRDIKIKWLQNKLKTEGESHKENQMKLDKLTQKLQEMKEESEQVRQDCQEMIRAYQVSEENRVFVLEQQLKEEQAKVILARHELDDKEPTYNRLQQEVDLLKSKNQLIIEENNLLSIKVQSLEKDRLECEQNLSRLKQSTDRQRQDVADLQTQLADFGSVKIHLQHEQERLLASQGEVERLRLSNLELQQEAETCRDREAELLNFTQLLTDKNVRLQSEFSATEAKAKHLEDEKECLSRQIKDLQARINSLSTELQQERGSHKQEVELLARALAESTTKCETLAQNVADLQGEAEILQKKHNATIKELMRELQQTRRKADRSESPNVDLLKSRTSSCSSLTGIPNHIENCNSNLGTDVQQNVTETVLHPEPDRQALIERIVKLQRICAKKTEKLEFMEEHTHQLVAELQKKSRLIQNYVLREQVGALAPAAMDMNKAEVTKHGGIMASLYSSKPVDNTMTLELSLEINKKLQAVLEETLLKNITLKENLDTLGCEVARLTKNRNL